MSIEVTGPQKYEFQDLVCVALSLRFTDLEDLEIFVEPPGREDALFRFRTEGQQREIEVQVKGAVADVTLGSVANCLTHFPAKMSSDCLLQRLRASGERSVLLIMSGRCTDVASKFIAAKPWRGAPHTTDFISLVDAKALLKEIGEQHRNPGSSDLEQARSQTCQGMEKDLSPDQLRFAAARIIVEELVTPEVVRSECEGILRKRFLIPNDKLGDAVNALAEAIRITKYESRRIGQAINASPRIGAVLNRFGSRPLMPADYVKRGTESAWCSTLSQIGALLLSGRPRCGKSYSAMCIAAEFQVMGYEIKQGTDIEDVVRYLLDGTASDRLYILDDPLGPLQPYADANRSIERLRWLLPRLQSNRKLVVAQSQDQLFEVMGKGSLPECAISEVQWQDLSAASPRVLARAWELMAVQHKVRNDVESAIAPALRSGELELELGSLRHLAATADKLPPNPTAPQALQQAREGARHLGLLIAGMSPSATNLLAALAIGSAPGKPLNLRELALLTQKDEPHFPWKGREMLGIFLGGSSQAEEFPSYESELKLPDDVIQLLDSLERRRFVSISHNAVQFAHAFYQAAAQSVFNTPTTFGAKLVIRMVNRSLFCLSPVTATSAVINAQWLSDALRSYAEERRQLFRLIHQGLQSLFPVVRDHCLGFLIQHLSELDPELSKDRAYWVQSALAISLDEVQWYEGQAWIPAQRNIFDSFESEFEKVAESEVQGNILLLEKRQLSKVPPEQAARILKFYGRSPELLSSQVALSLLGYEEAIIRARAAGLWFAVERVGDSELVDRIFQERHPAVILSVYEAVIRAWPQVTADRQHLVSARLRDSASLPEIATALLPELVVFDRVEHTGESPPWQLFEAVAPGVLEALPDRAIFNSARLYSVMKSAMRFCRPEAVVSICNSWIEWLKREIKSSMLEEYALSVGDILIRAARNNSDLRGGMVQQLLLIRPTAALIYILRDLQDLWDDLTAPERAAILELLGSKRPDERWLRAVALTRNSVPTELQMFILGGSDALQNSPADLMIKLPPELLNACIMVQCGRPDVFWDLSHGSKLFDAIVRLIENDPSHPLFEIAFQEAVFPMDDQRVTKIVQSAKDSQIEKVFQLLLRQRTEWTGNFLPETWATLLARPDESTRSKWFQQMASVASACIDDLTELREWLSRNEDQESLLRLLTGDVAVESLLLALTRSKPEDQNRTTELLLQALREDPPRLFKTCDSIKSGLERTRVRNEPLSALVAAIRSTCLERRKEIKEEYRFRPQFPQDWISRQQQ